MALATPSGSDGGRAAADGPKPKTTVPPSGVGANVSTNERGNRSGAAENADGKPPASLAQILTLRLTTPSRAASCFVSESSGSNRIDPSVFTGTATIAAEA